MKKLIILIVVLALIIGSGVFADDITVEIDGRKLDFDVSPTIIDDRTVLPARTIFESLGLEVKWDEATRAVTGLGQGTSITFVIDQRLAHVNGQPVNLDVAPTIVHDRSMVPVRFLAESTGANVDWDSGTRTVFIEKDSNHKEDSFKDHTYIEVDGGDLSGQRLPNVVVNIGFGERDYWAYTNDHGQLVRVIADEIILQDEDNEPVLSTGRYYYDEAKVPGTEHPELDEGHVIADSLGGVSNAYNITPQNSTLNRHGDQAYMEKTIRDAGGARNFEAIITYPNTRTQVPSHYKYTYTVLGNEIVDEFDNINPDDYNPGTSLSDFTIPQILEGDFNLESLIGSVDLDVNITDIKSIGMGLIQSFKTNTRNPFQ